MLLKRGFLLFVLFFGFSSASYACWDRKEYRNIEGYSELEDKLILSYKDAVSCAPVDGATVQLGKLVYTTDARGYVSLPMAPFIEAGNLEMPLKISKPGYITIHTDLIVAAGTVLNRRLLLSPEMASRSMRFILQWGDEPKDLDLHLEGDGYHISYRNMRSAGSKARLDQDQTDGYGPETITLEEINPGSSYSLWVDNFSGEEDYLGSEKVLVYTNNQLTDIIPISPTRERRVDVLKIAQSTIQKQTQKAPVKSAATSDRPLTHRVYPGW